MKFYENVDGLTEASGFFCAGIHCDVRGKRDGRVDLGIVYSKRPCSGAGVFTTNDVKAAPVLLDKPYLLNKMNFMPSLRIAATPTLAQVLKVQWIPEPWPRKSRDSLN